MIRIKDPKISTKFYEDHFGLTLIKTMAFPEARFTVYFMAYDSPEADSYGRAWTDREGLLELTHNHGVEDDANFKVNNGNDDEAHQGFGHIAFSVDNLTQVCATLAAAGVQFKNPHSDAQHTEEEVAYAVDPDGYYIALLPLVTSASAPQKSKWRFNHTFLRVKDIEESLRFYTGNLGMTTLKRISHADREQAFVGYYRNDEEQGNFERILGREGLVELMQSHGTEKSDIKYHNGNDQPQGFGHLCITVDDLDAACARLEGLSSTRWKKRLTDGRMKDVAFLLDPDGYWVEVIQNETIKKRAGW